MSEFLKDLESECSNRVSMALRVVLMLNLVSEVLPLSGPFLFKPATLQRGSPGHLEKPIAPAQILPGPAPISSHVSEEAFG